MGYDSGENKGSVSNFNPNKEISIEMVLDILLKHKNAMYKSYFGKDLGEESDIDDNTRIERQASSIRDMISSQMMIIDLIARPIIEKNCNNTWNKRYKTDKDKKENPFSNEENDIKKIMRWRRFLKKCFEALIKADKTPTLDDDFMVTQIDGSNGKEQNHLTENFFDIRDDLAESYNGIYGLLIDHEIVTKKQQEDEGLTYEEQTEEFMKRFEEA